MTVQPLNFHRQQGLTLLELVVALTVFSILSITAYSGLSSVVNAKQRSEQQAARLADLQKTFMWVMRDIEQAVPRSIRDEYGQEEPALHTNHMQYPLVLTRTGWSNVTGRARSELQRVAYYTKDEQLIRGYWPALDRATDQGFLEVALLDQVKHVEFRFLDNDAPPQWQSKWPLSITAGSANPVSPLPRAVEVTIEALSWGKVTRLFIVPGAE